MSTLLKDVLPIAGFLAVVLTKRGEAAYNAAASAVEGLVRSVLPARR